MKIICKKLMSLFLAMVMVLSGVVLFNDLKEEKAYALSSDFQPISGVENVYYFSDSTPSRQGELDSTVGLFVEYDIHYLITPQEFNFMVFTGYFWDLIPAGDEDINITAIFEFKTTKPDETLLVNFFNFLIENGVDVLFISAYYDEYTFYDEIMESDDASFVSMYCNVDRFALFLRNSFRSMMEIYSGFQNKTALLVDGRYAGITSALEEYNLGQLCYNSPTLRRIVNYSKFGYTEDDELLFEKDLFKDLWQLYFATYFEPFVRELPDYFSDLNISMNDFYDVWLEMKENENAIPEDLLEEYNAQYEILFSEYYDEIASELISNNIHILLNVESNKYVDILAELPSNICIDDYVGFSNVASELDYIFALAIGPWSGQYRALLEYIIDNISDFASGLTSFPTYTWWDPEIPDTLSNTATSLFDFFNCGDRFPVVDDEEFLASEFLSKLFYLINN